MQQFILRSTLLLAGTILPLCFLTLRAQMIFATPEAEAQAEAAPTIELPSPESPRTTALPGTDSVVLTASFLESAQAPQPRLKGTHIYVQCDTVYLVNPVRYRLYRDLHRSILEDSIGLQLEKFAALYDSTTRRMRRNVDALLENGDKAAEVTGRFIDSLQQSVTKANAELTSTVAILDNAANNLKEAEKNIRKARWKIAGSGLGGLLAGAAIGILVGNRNK